MDFALTEEQKFFQKSIAETMDRLVAPRAEAIDQTGEFPRDLWQQFGELGFFGLRHKKELGGMEADAITSILFFEELCRASFGFGSAVTMQCLMGTYFLARFGNADIIETLLKPAIRGEKIGVICFTEDQSGSDLGATRTRATRDGDDWIIHGKKMWITNAPLADFYTVLATSDPSKGMKGLNFFLVERDRAGVSTGQTLEKLGAKGTITGEVLFDDVRVPGTNLLGEKEGMGVVHLGEILDFIRCATAAMALGLSRAAYTDALEYARKRVAFGKPIAAYQLIRSKFAEMSTEMEAARLLTTCVAWEIDRGIPCRVKACQAKMFATEVCCKVVDEGTRIFGGNAFAHEYPAQRYFRDARFLLYGGGTHEVLKNFIGREVIGKL
ncbi:MAG: acyl-CoA dehydrogenase family protein [Planctomycetota bacterium]|jgi:alkylation response protein AidB-like acyl-CoA dehydrogenase